MKASPGNEIIMLDNRLAPLSGSKDYRKPLIAAHEGSRMTTQIRVPDVTGTMDDMRITHGNVGDLAPVSMDRSGRMIVFFRNLGACCLSVPMRWDLDWDYTFNCMSAHGTIRNGKSGYVCIYPDGRVTKSDNMD